jgi:hypothetical protein
MHAQEYSGDVVSKGEFARRRNVSPGRVSQWISEGKIHGKAIVGEGRSARIDETVACQQLDRRLDVGQRFGNGLHTKLDAVRGPVALASNDATGLSEDGERPAGLQFDRVRPPISETVADKIQREKLQELERRNREGARQEAVAAGLLTDAASVRQVVGRETAKLLSSFEGALANFASAIAAQFKQPQRDVLHVLRAELRKFRAAEADIAKAQAAAVLPTVAYDVPDPDEAAPPRGDDDDTGDDA